MTNQPDVKVGQVWARVDRRYLQRRRLKITAVFGMLAEVRYVNSGRNSRVSCSSLWDRRRYRLVEDVSK